MATKNNATKSKKSINLMDLLKQVQQSDKVSEKTANIILDETIVGDYIEFGGVKHDLFWTKEFFEKTDADRICASRGINAFRRILDFNPDKNKLLENASSFKYFDPECFSSQERMTYLNNHPEKASQEYIGGYVSSAGDFIYKPFFPFEEVLNSKALTEAPDKVIERIKIDHIHTRENTEKLKERLSKEKNIPEQTKQKYIENGFLEEKKHKTRFAVNNSEREKGSVRQKTSRFAQRTINRDDQLF